MSLIHMLSGSTQINLSHGALSVHRFTQSAWISLADDATVPRSTLAVWGLKGTVSGCEVFVGVSICNR